ncbi:MAG: chemotaxis protein CheW [candidate division KSB1 bacterium]|nr:chemotaxis protein CheW [candidate division KSB1 bacterium]
MIGFMLESLDRLKMLHQKIEVTGMDETPEKNAADIQSLSDVEGETAASPKPAVRKSRKNQSKKTPKRGSQRVVKASKAETVGKEVTAEDQTGKTAAINMPKSASDREFASQTETTDLPSSLSHWHQNDTAIRVDVSILDRLMNMVGELVLARNQILRFADRSDDPDFQAATHRLNQVTSELQEGIMKTRMQPVGHIFSRFHRVVRDLSHILNKEVELKLEGEDTELDKTLLEAMRDPLLHLVRNAIDHGIEPKEVRERIGKPIVGTIILRAYHESGQVNLEVIDDGQGIDPEKLRQKAVEKGLINPTEARALSDRDVLNLIFRPGFSTAAKVTNLSGRGVGMDVVKTHIEKIGGSVEVHSELGAGTTIRIKIPLTLAIIPALIVTCSGQRFAIPQVNLVELVRLEGETRRRIERIGDAEVFRLRGELLPILRLNRLLGFDEPMDAVSEDREIQVIVLAADQMQFGLAVDDIHDREEIVVKALNRKLKNIDCFAGATVMGDGKVILILDAMGLAQRARIQFEKPLTQINVETGYTHTRDRFGHSLLLFTPDDNTLLAVPAPLVARLETLSPQDIKDAGHRQVIQHHKKILPIIHLNEHLPVPAVTADGDLSVIVFEIDQRQVGILAKTILDIVDILDDIDTQALPHEGVLGSLIWEDRLVQIIDIYKLVAKEFPEWLVRKAGATPSTAPSRRRILLVEDSLFIRSIEKSYLESEGYIVVEAGDGIEALARLREQAFDLVITDIEMPHMDGLALCRAIRETPEWRQLPIIVVSSRNRPEDITAGKKAGADAYLIKLNRDEVIETIERLLKAKTTDAIAEAEIL